MRRWLLFLLSTVVLTGLFSCSGRQSFKVGYLNPSDQRIRFVRDGNYMAERLRELGHEVVIVSADDNDIVQLEQGMELVDQGVDALVIVAVNGNTIAPLVRYANERGVKVIAYNRLINNVDFDFFVAGDNEGFARKFYEAAISHSPTGNWVILGGDRFDRNGFEIMQNIQALLQPHIASGRINLLYSTYIEGWNRQRASHEMQQVIDAHGTDIDVIIAFNDVMGLGAIDVLKQHDAHHDVLVTGQGANSEAVRSVYQGELFMTIYHPHRELGRRTAEMVNAILNGEDIDNLSTSYTFNGMTEIATVRFPSIMVTRENLEEVLINTGEFTWSDVR